MPRPLRTGPGPGEPVSDALVELTLVLLHRQDVIGPAVADLRGDRPRATHGVDGHDAAVQIQHFQQLGNGGDLIGFLRSLDLAQGLGVRRGPGADQVYGPLFPDVSYDRRAVLPSMATTAPGSSCALAWVQDPKQLWNWAGSGRAKTAPKSLPPRKWGGQATRVHHHVLDVVRVHSAQHGTFADSVPSTDRWTKFSGRLVSQWKQDSQWPTVECELPMGLSPRLRYSESPLESRSLQ